MDTKYLLFMFQHWQTIQNIKKYAYSKGKTSTSKGEMGEELTKSEEEESETAMGDNHCKLLVL